MRKILMAAGLLLGLIAAPAQAHHPYSMHDDYYVSTQFHPDNDKDTSTPLTTVDIWYDSTRPIPGSFVAPLLNALDTIESYANTSNLPWAAHQLEFRIRGNIAVTSGWAMSGECQHEPSSHLKRSIVFGHVNHGQNGGWAQTSVCLGSAGWIWDSYVATNSWFASTFYYTGSASPTPLGKLDMEALFLHEISHAIGFTGKVYSEVINSTTLERVGAIDGHFFERPELCPEFRAAQSSPALFRQSGSRSRLLAHHLPTNIAGWCYHEENSDAGACSTLVAIPASQYRTMCWNQPVGMTVDDAHLQAIQAEMRSYTAHDVSALRAGYKKFWP